MADGDLFKLDAEDLKAVGAAPRNPHAVVAGVRGIPPQDAVDAITHAPAAGVPPSLAMHDPAPVKDMARTQNDQAILNNSPAVRRWAGGEPARTAATQDDFPALAKIGGWFEDRFSDFIAPAQEGWKSYTEGLDAVRRADTGKRTGFTSLLPQETDAQATALAKVEEGASRLSPFSLIPNTLGSPFTRPAARQIVKIPGYVPKGKTEEQEIRDTSDVLNIVGSVFIPLGIGKAFSRKTPSPEPTPEGFTPGPAGGINRDFAHPVDEAGVVLGEGDTPLNFATQKEAAQWILKKGYADRANPQIFEVGTAEGEGFVVKQSGLTEGAMPRPGTSPVSDSVYAAAAEADGKRIATLEQQIAESKTQGRSPAIMAQFLEEQTPGRMVWIDPEKALALYNDAGIVPAADDAILGSVPGFLQQLENAATAGHDIQVPLSGYLAASAGKPWADGMRDSVRFREDGVSVEESKILGEQDEPQVGEAPAFEAVEGEAPRAEALAAASRDAIVAQVKTQFLNGLFKDEKSAGMTKDQFNRYSKAVDEAVGNAYAKLVERAYNQIRRERTPEWKAAFDQTLAKVEGEFFSRPDILALFYLRYGQHPNGAPVEALKLRKTAVQDMYGEGLTKALPDGIFGRDGVTADEAAEVFGYESGDSMLRELAALEDGMRATGMSPRDYLSKLTKAQAHRETGETLGFDITPESIHAAASEAIASPEIQDILTDELHALADQAGLTLDREGIALEAERIFGQLPVKLALNIKEFERVIGIKGRMAEVNLLKGKPVEAFRAKQQQLMNQIMLQRAHALTRDFTKTEKKFQRWARTSANKNIDQAYMNYVHAALFRLGYRVKRDFEELMDQIGDTSLDEFIAAKSLEGKIIISGDFPGQPLKEMKVNEYDAARDTLSSLVHNGRLEAGVVILGRRESLASTLDRIRENGDKLGRKLTPERIEKLNAIQQAAKAVNAYMLKAEQLLDEVDLNDPQGPLNQTVTYPLQAAKGWENDKLEEITRALKAFGKTQPKAWLGQMKTKIDTGLMWTNPRTGLKEPVVQTKGKLIRLMLNLGNERNLDKLLQGYDWELDEVMNAVERYATKSDWDFVQLLWDQHESLWPDVVRVYRNLSGIAPKRVKPRSIETPFGTYTGGYFPISYDKLRAPEIRTMSQDSIWGDDYTSALPGNNYTKGRTGYVAPINLAFEGLNKTIGQVVHDLAFREALSQSARVLSSPDVKNAVQDNFGPSYASQLRPWLEYTARERVFDDRSGQWIENFLAGTRSNITFVGLAYRASSALIHGTVAFGDSVGEVGAKDFGDAVLKLYQSPSQHKYWMDFVQKNSPEVRHRLLNMDNNVREAVQRLAEKQGFLDDVQKFGYHFLAISDQLSAVPTWIAAYGQEIRAGRSPEEAFQIADKRLRQAHGSGAPVDLAAVQRGGQGPWGEIGKTTTGMFLSFMNHNYNRIWRIGRQVGEGAENAKAGDWAGASRDWSNVTAMSLAYMVWPAIAVTAIHQWLKTGSPIPHSATDWVDGIAHATFGGLPGVGLLLEALEHKQSESPLERAVSTNVHTIDNAWKALSGHSNKVSKRWLQQAMEAAGYWTGKVPGQAASTSQYIWNISTGAEHPPRNFNEFIRGILGGPKVKEHK